MSAPDPSPPIDNESTRLGLNQLSARLATFEQDLLEEEAFEPSARNVDLIRFITTMRSLLHVMEAPHNQEMALRDVQIFVDGLERSARAQRNAGRLGFGQGVTSSARRLISAITEHVAVLLTAGGRAGTFISASSRQSLQLLYHIGTYATGFLDTYFRAPVANIFARQRVGTREDGIATEEAVVDPFVDTEPRPVSPPSAQLTPSGTLTEISTDDDSLGCRTPPTSSNRVPPVVFNIPTILEEEEDSRPSSVSATVIDTGLATPSGHITDDSAAPSPATVSRPIPTFPRIPLPSPLASAAAQVAALELTPSSASTPDLRRSGSSTVAETPSVGSEGPRGGTPRCLFPTSAPKTHRFMIACGNGYEGSGAPLPSCVTDVERFCRTVRLHCADYMEKLNGRRLDNVTRADFVDAFHNMVEKIRRVEWNHKDDNILFILYFSGHGAARDGKPVLYMQEDPNNEDEETGVDLQDLIDIVNTSRTHFVVLLDCCSSEEWIERPTENSEITNAITILTACDPGKKAYGSVTAEPSTMTAAMIPILDRTDLTVESLTSQIIAHFNPMPSPGVARPSQRAWVQTNAWPTRLYKDL